MGGDAGDWWSTAHMNAMPGSRSHDVHPVILDAAEALASGPVAAIVHHEALRIAQSSLTGIELGSMDPADVTRAVEAALVETVGAEMAVVARRLMLTSPVRPRTKSAVLALLGALTGTTRIGVLGRLKL